VPRALRALAPARGQPVCIWAPALLGSQRGLIATVTRSRLVEHARFRSHRLLPQRRQIGVRVRRPRAARPSLDSANRCSVLVPQRRHQRPRQLRTVTMIPLQQLHEQRRPSRCATRRPAAVRRPEGGQLEPLRCVAKSWAGALCLRQPIKLETPLLSCSQSSHVQKSKNQSETVCRRRFETLVVGAACTRSPQGP